MNNQDNEKVFQKSQINWYIQTLVNYLQNAYKQRILMNKETKDEKL